MTELPTILVVDDEVRSLESIRRILSDEFEVLATTDTSQALQLFETNTIEVLFATCACRAFPASSS